jgi:PIN domain nuclease of toxin-antitoxin system
VTPAPLLDTHAWLWWIHRDVRLGEAALDALDGFPPDGRPFVSDISLWEVAMLTARGRLDLAKPLVEWLEAASHPRSVRVVAISARIAAETTTFARSSLKDPADRIIVATSRVFGLPLFTHDRAILRSQLAARWTPDS